MKKNFIFGKSLLCLMICLLMVGCSSKKTSEFYSVTYMVDGKEYKVETKLKEGAIVNEPIVPTKTGYKFDGWYVGNEKYDFSKPITNEMTLEARWIKNDVSQIKTYTITFNTDGGNSINQVKVNENELLVRPANPTKAGYEFDNWYMDNNVFDFNTKITSNMTLTAKWNKKQETVTKPTQQPTTKPTTKPAQQPVEEKNIEKTENKVESVSFQTEQIDEKNMKRGQQQVIQNGVEGEKTITYKVTYNSKGQELSRVIVNEVINKQPINQIVKIGISDYNLNTDKYRNVNLSYCSLGKSFTFDAGLGKDLIDCNEPPIDVPGIIMNNTFYTKNGNVITAQFNNNYENNVYSNGSGYYYSMVGSGENTNQLLSQQICDTYNFSCGRW